MMIYSQSALLQSKIEDATGGGYVRRMVNCSKAL